MRQWRWRHQQEHKCQNDANSTSVSNRRHGDPIFFFSQACDDDDVKASQCDHPTPRQHQELHIVSHTDCQTQFQGAANAHSASQRASDNSSCCGDYFVSVEYLNVDNIQRCSDSWLSHSTLDEIKKFHMTTPDLTEEHTKVVTRKRAALWGNEFMCPRPPVLHDKQTKSPAMLCSMAKQNVDKFCRSRCGTCD